MTDIVITRIFEAPRELVYKAFTDPDQLSQWFGPVGYSVPRDSVDIDARTGGHERFTMVNDANPEEKAPVDATFTEVVENELLVSTEVWEMEGELNGTTMACRIEFHDEDGGKTRVVITQGPYTSEIAEMAKQGWESSFTKLDKLLIG